MAGDPPRKTPPPPADGGATEDEEKADREDRRFGDFVRRAVSAGFEAASRSKDDVLRIATSEIRSWLDHLDLDRELVKALAKMTIEVKAEIKFRSNEDGGLVPETQTRMKLRRSSGGDADDGTDKNRDP